MRHGRPQVVKQQQGVAVPESTRLQVRVSFGHLALVIHQLEEWPEVLQEFDAVAFLNVFVIVNMRVNKKSGRPTFEDLIKSWQGKNDRERSNGRMTSRA